MHEFAVTKQLLNLVRKTAEENHAEKVTDVYLRIGALRGMINEWIVRYFAFAGKGTITEGAKVHIETVPGSLVCRCGAVTPLSPGDLNAVCCSCGSKELRILTGVEFMLAGIGVSGSTQGEDHV